MFGIFRHRKPKQQLYPLGSHPFFQSLLVSFFALWFCVLNAYFLSTHLIVRAQLSPQEARLFAHPWTALLVGSLMGALMILAINQYEWRHADEIARCRAERRSIFTMRAYVSFCALTAMVVVGATSVFCHVTRMSGIVGIYASLIPYFLAYRVKSHIYRLAVQHYRTARESESETAGPIAPSRRQKIRYAALIALPSMFLVACTIIILCWMPSVVLSNLSAARIEGMQISSDCAQYFEECLIKEPDVSERRAKLVGYYESLYARTPSPETASRLHGHLLWFIEHDPVSFVGNPKDFLARQDGGDTDPLQEAERLWEKAIDLHPKSALILSYAADFFCYAENDFPKAIELMARCAALYPKNPEWAAKLGCFKALQQRQNVETAAK